MASAIDYFHHFEVDCWVGLPLGLAIMRKMQRHALYPTLWATYQRVVEALSNPTRSRYMMGYYQQLWVPFSQMFGMWTLELPNWVMRHKDIFQEACDAPKMLPSRVSLWSVNNTPRQLRFWEKIYYFLLVKSQKAHPKAVGLKYNQCCLVFCARLL